jgi:hypothetical protein
MLIPLHTEVHPLSVIEAMVADCQALGINSPESVIRSRTVLTGYLVHEEELEFHRKAVPGD